MLYYLKSVKKFPHKVINQLALLRRDPVKFANNLLQFTHPPLFEQRLIDIMNPMPMHVRIDPTLRLRPSLNVLSSALTKEGMTGGPNTIINLAFRVAQQGVPVRMVTTVETCTIEPDWFRTHAAELVGSTKLPEIPIVSASKSDHPLSIGFNDVFMATHWTTAQQLKRILPHLCVQKFFYMLQEFEPSFYPWSSNYALALETFGLDFFPVFNEAILADFFFDQALGRFADPDLHRCAMIFEPAIDDRLFHIGDKKLATRPRRLLFYARPSNTRNMFGLGLMALRQASSHEMFRNGWEFFSIGSRGSVPSLSLENGNVLRPSPWMNYVGYAELLRESDILLCPMLSPHTSYPVLEMAASGGISVTNTFATKTREALYALSNNIIGAEPTIEALADGIVEAAERTNRGHVRSASLNMARDWSETLDPVASRMAEIFFQLSNV
jgi:hypothetical protein